jgi:excisionase family DNA binding protein
MNGSNADTTRAMSAPLTAADVLHAGEVAALLHMPRSSVEDLARRGVVPSRKVGRRRLFVRSKIEAMLLDA